MPATHAIAEGVAAFMVACPPSLIPPIVQDLNTLVGLVGFAITLGVWWQVRAVRSSFRTRARLPQLVSDLQAQLQCLEKLIGDSAPAELDTQRVLASAGALLRSAIPVAPKHSRKAVRHAIKALDGAATEATQGDASRHRRLLDAFGALCAAAVNLDQHALDLNWT